MTWGQADTERRLANMVRVATITAVDPGSGRARVSFGQDAESAWLPFPSPRAGAIQIWAPPSVGEQVVVACQSGDTAQGMIVASLASGGSPAPSGDGGAFVVEIGGSRFEITGDAITLTCGGTVVEMTAGGVAIIGDVQITGALAVDGASVAHNGTNIGDSHVHGGIAIGGANTLGPQ
jgi:phage baseplate assembly protein V